MSEWTFESNRGVFSFFFFKKNFYWSIVVLQCCVSFYYSKVNQPYIYVCMHAQCLSPCDPMDCSPPGSSVLGILQARILEWVATSFSRGSS